MSDHSKHHFLCAGRVLFQDENNAEAVAIVDVNCLMVDVRRNIGVKQLGKIQHGLQANLFERLGGPVAVKGVTILTINYLGAMSEKEFNNQTPDDLQPPADKNVFS